MKNVPIKFRGVNIATDKYVYGYYSVMYSPYITSSEKADEYSLYQVYPESVAQLIGYDVDGNEIYEGDVLVDENGENNIAVAIANLVDETLLEIFERRFNVFKKYNARLMKG